MPLAIQTFRWHMPGSAMRVGTTSIRRCGAELSVNDVLQHMVHEGKVGIHALELGVMLMQLSQLRKMRDGHPVELVIPLVVGGFADAVLPTNLTDLDSQFDLFQDADDLTFAEL